MSLHYNALPNGKTGPEGLTRLTGKLLSGSGVLGAGDLAVSADTPSATMNLKIAAGDVVMMDGAICGHGYSTAVETRTVAANATGVTKIDTVIAWRDPTVAIGASTPENNTNGMKLAIIRRASGAGLPQTSDYTAVVGSNVYYVLAEVTVINGAGSINSGNIADKRGVVGIPRSIGTSIPGLKMVSVSGTPGYNGLAAGAGANETITFAGITTVVFASLVFQKGAGGSNENRLTWSSDTQFSVGGNQVKFNVFNNGASAAFISNVVYVAFGY